MYKLLNKLCFKVVIFILCAVCIFTSCTPKQDPTISDPSTTIVENGISDYKIVVRSSATQTEVFAATELSSFIKQSTDVEIEIVSDSEVIVGDKYFFLGETIQLKEKITDFDYATLKTDGFFIKTINNSVYINSPNFRGIAYGVYEFIERFLGVRFVTADFTHVPKNDVLKINNHNIEIAPLFAQRYYYSQEAIGLFELRSRMLGGYSQNSDQYSMKNLWFQGVNRDHNSLQYVDIETWKKGHPEFFTDYTNIQSSHIDLCYTSGLTADGKVADNMDVSVFSIVLDKLKSFISQDLSAEYFMFGRQDDPYALCNCDMCKDSREKNGETGLMLIFLNNLSEEITKWADKNYPEREIKLVSFAYHSTVFPPTVKNSEGKWIARDQKLIPHENLYIYYAPVEANFSYSYLDEKQDSEVRDQIEGWSALTKNLMFWDYDIHFREYFWYYPNTYYLKENMSFYAEFSSEYIMQLGSFNEKSNWQQDLRFYLSKQLYWDKNLNMTEATNEFLNLYFAESASFIKEYMSIMDTHVYQKMDSKEIDLRCTVEGDYLESSKWPIELLEKSIDIITNGMDFVENNQSYNAEQKATYTRRLKNALITPYRMIMRNYSDYYNDNEEVFASKFFELADEFGYVRYSENQAIDSLKNRYN